MNIPSKIMNIPLKRLLPLVLLALLVLLIICFIMDIGRIQGKLRNNSHAALNAQGCNFSKEDITFRGRDGVLSGSISEQDRGLALSTVRGIRGVNRVKDNLTMNAAAGCSSRVASVTPPVAAPVATPVVAAAPLPPTCRILSAEEGIALQSELNAITAALPEERFAVGNLSTTPALRSHLESAVSVLSQNEYKNAHIDIVGYTESALLPIYNECLSSGRASAVQDFLVSRGIDPNCLSVSAAGGNSALASSDTAEGRRLNRRIEFVVQEVK